MLTVVKIFQNLIGSQDKEAGDESREMPRMGRLFIEATQLNGNMSDLIACLYVSVI